MNQSTEQALVLLQDLTGLLSELQPLTGAEPHLAANLRGLRRRVLSLQTDLASPHGLLLSYRADALDAVDGLRDLFGRNKAPNNDHLQEILFAMELAAPRIRAYFEMRDKPQKLSEAVNPTLQLSQGGMA